MCNNVWPICEDYRLKNSVSDIADDFSAYEWQWTKRLPQSYPSFPSGVTRPGCVSQPLRKLGSGMWIVSFCCVTNNPQTRWLKITTTYQVVCWDGSFWKPRERMHSLPLVVSRGCRHSSDSGHITPVSALVISWPSSLL